MGHHLQYSTSGPPRKLAFGSNKRSSVGPLCGPQTLRFPCFEAVADEPQTRCGGSSWAIVNTDEQPAPTMPRRSNSFQRLVALINTSLAGVTRVEESAMLPDSVTGHRREVDILITSEVAGYIFRIGIEVSATNRKADTPWVERMRSKHADLPTDKLILVSESGFAKSAEIKAKFYGIETLSIANAKATDWSLLVALTSTGSVKIYSMPFTCGVVCTFEDETQEHFYIPNSATITTDKGVSTLDTFVCSLLYKPEFRDLIAKIMHETSQKDFWFSYSEDSGLWRIKRGGKPGQVTELRVGLKVSKTETPIEFASGRYSRSVFLSAKSRTANSPLHFVLTRTDCGAVSGVMLDETGLREVKESS